MNFNLIFDYIIYVIKYLKFFGCLPVTEDNEGRLLFSWTSLRTVVSGGIIAIVTSLSVWCGVTIRTIQNGGKINLEQEFILYFYMAIVVTTPIAGITMLFNSTNVVQFINAWESYQEAHQFISGRYLSGGNKILQLAYVVQSVLKSTLLAGGSVFIVFYKMRDVYALDKSFYAPFYIVVAYFFVLTDGLLGATLWVLKGIRDAGEDLRLSFKGCDGSTRSIIVYHRLWGELSELTSAASSIFGSTLVIFVLCGYYLSMTCWFYLIIGTRDVFLTLELGIMTTLMSVLIPEACEKTNSTVASLMQKEIILMRRKKKLTDGKNRQELDWFEKTLVDCEPSIELAGSFALDRGSIFLVYAAFLQAMLVIYSLKLQAKQKIDSMGLV